MLAFALALGAGANACHSEAEEVSSARTVVVANTASPAASQAVIPPSTPAPSKPAPPTLTELLAEQLRTIPDPTAELARGNISSRVKSELGALGSLSVGLPNRGALVNAVAMPESEHWTIADPARAWGTTETVTVLSTLLNWYFQHNVDAPKLTIGQLSSRNGGWLKRHRSHQSGRDVDLGVFYSDGSRWYTRVTRENLDVRLTWGLVQQLAETELVEYIFADRSIIQMLREYAGTLGLSAHEMATIFYEGGDSGGILRHEWGHRTHLHVRFRNPVAERVAKAVFVDLIRARIIPGRKYY